MDEEYTEDREIKEIEEAEAAQEQIAIKLGIVQEIEEDDALNYEGIQYLAAAGCTDEEVAAVLGYSYRSFKRRKVGDEDLREALKTGVPLGKGSLRRKMLEKALGGNIGMMIWLSKNWLNMSDRADFTFAEKPTTGVLVVPAQLSAEEWAKKHGGGEPIEDFDETPKGKLLGLER